MYKFNEFIPDDSNGDDQHEFDDRLIALIVIGAMLYLAIRCL